MSTTDTQPDQSNESAEQNTDQVVETSQALEDNLDFDEQVNDVSETEPAEVSKDDAETQVETGDESANEKEEASDQTESEEQSKDTHKDEQPKESEAERNRRFYELRQQQKRQTAQAIDQVYQPQPVDQLTQHFMDQGYDQFQAEMLARDEVRNQREQINEAKAEIAETTFTALSESMMVLKDFPVFDPDSSEYDEEFANMAGQLWQQSGNVVIDPRTNQIVELKSSPYTFYQKLAEMRNSGEAKQQIKAQKAVEQQMAAVAPPSSTAPVVKKSKEDQEADELREAFDMI